MKTKLLILFLAINSLIYAQVPTDAVAAYEFTNGSLENFIDPGNGDLSGATVSNAEMVADRNGNPNRALKTNIDRNGYRISGNNISVSFWLKLPNQGQGSENRILQAFDNGGNTGFDITYLLSTNELRVRYLTSSGNVYAHAVVNLVDNNWHHIVYTTEVTSNQTTGKIYIDGVLNNAISNTLTLNHTNPFLTSPGLFVISPLGNSVQQEIDDIYLFERAISSTEVTALKNLSTSITGGLLYVNKTATGNNSGTSWANAYTNLQDAITNSSTDSEIWVAAGTYTPGTTNQSTFTIEGKNDLKIYGGFNGTETALSQRDITANPTILSGDLNGDDNTNITHTEATRSDNAYHIVSLKGSGSNILIDGFTISGGNANGTSSFNCSTPANNQNDYRTGGAIYAQAYNEGTITATIKNCILENNSAESAAAYGLFNACGQQFIDTNVYFENCIVRNNYSYNLSTFSFTGAQQWRQFARGSIVNSVFYNNTSTSGASCVLLSASNGVGRHGLLGTSDGIDVDIINSTFTNNNGTNGYVIDMWQADNTTIANSIIWGNGSTAPFNSTISPSVVSNSIVEGGQLSAMNANPLFANAANDDFTLKTGSPALDAGDNNKVPSHITLDLAGNSRIYNTTVDMGAYEFTTLNTLEIKLEKANIKLYPVPNYDGKLFIKVPELVKVERIQIYDLNGKLIIDNSKFYDYLSISKLQKGNYLVRITTNKGIVSKKLIKL